MARPRRGTEHETLDRSHGSLCQCGCPECRHSHVLTDTRRRLHERRTDGRRRGRTEGHGCHAAHRDAHRTGPQRPVVRQLPVGLERDLRACRRGHSLYRRSADAGAYEQEDFHAGRHRRGVARFAGGVRGRRHFREDPTGARGQVRRPRQAALPTAEGPDAKTARHCRLCVPVQALGVRRAVRAA